MSQTCPIPISVRDPTATPMDPMELEKAVRDPSVVTRYRALIYPYPAPSGCWVWIGALSARGSGRFWIGQGHVMVAHRFGIALARNEGSFGPLQVAHMCDEAWCQNPEHWELSSARKNTQDWIVRRERLGSPLRDTRGSLGRARAVRFAAISGGDIGAALLAGAPEADRFQDQLPGID